MSATAPAKPRTARRARADAGVMDVRIVNLPQLENHDPRDGDAGGEPPEAPPPPGRRLAEDRPDWLGAVAILLLCAGLMLATYAITRPREEKP